MTKSWQVLYVVPQRIIPGDDILDNKPSTLISDLPSWICEIRSDVQQIGSWMLIQSQHSLLIVFWLSHYFVVIIVPLLIAIFSSSFTWICCLHLSPLVLRCVYTLLSPHPTCGTSLGMLLLLFMSISIFFQLDAILLIPISYNYSYISCIICFRFLFAPFSLNHWSTIGSSTDDLGTFWLGLNGTCSKFLPDLEMSHFTS